MEKSKNKTETIKIRLSADEKKDWEAKANIGGFSLSELARKAVTRVKIWKLKDRVTEQARIIEMARINNNLSEIGRQVKIYKSEGESQRIIDSLKEVKKELENLKNSLTK